MLKLRVIPTLLYDGLTLVKGKNFESWRTVSALIQQVQIYALRGVDEMILLDISSTNKKTKINFNLIKDITENIFMPFTVGGGIKNIHDIQNLFISGNSVLRSAGSVNPGLTNMAISIKLAKYIEKII